MKFKFQKKFLIMGLFLFFFFVRCSVNRSFDVSKIKINDEKGLHLLDFQHIHQKERYDCGAGALTIILNYWGIPDNPENILKNIFSEVPINSGIMAGDLKKYAEKKGLSAFLLKMNLNDIHQQIDKGRPIITYRKLLGGINHYEVIVGYDSIKKTIIIADPAGLPYYIKENFFLKRHKKVDNFALLIARRDK